MLYCRDCGKENPDDAKYCCNCGTLLTLQPTQGTGLRSLPEIKPDNVEEIEDVPDLTEINVFPKEEIKLELPEKVEPEPVVLLEEESESAPEPEKDENDKKEYIEIGEPKKKGFPWLTAIAVVFVILLIIFLIVKFKK